VDSLFDSVTLSRLQFALTAMFHILWPVLTIGLSLFLVLLEILWLKTRDPDYYRHARFWSKLLLLNFGIGVVSGIPLEFEFGTNWAPFSIAAGDFFGNILGFEGAMAFMLEAGFLGIMLFGWQRVPSGIHLFATTMVAFGASLSAFWIMAANGWMQTPAGVHFENGSMIVDSYAAAIFNPAMPTSVMHMWLACLETSLFVIGGISAWYLLKDRHSAFFLKSFRLALLAAVIVTPLQILVGDAAGRMVAEQQPAKLAAIEGHWQTNPPGKGAAWALLAWPDAVNQRNHWSIEVPNLLSLITTHSLTGRVAGLREFPTRDQPPVLVPFYAFRLMVLAGVTLAALMLWSVSRWRRGAFTAAGISGERTLLRAWITAIPLAYLAVEMGWLTREVGRQPWIIYGMMHTEAAASALPAAAVAATLLSYFVTYATLLIIFIVFAGRLIRRGPDLDVPLPAATLKNGSGSAPTADISRVS
jgi:cytochrome d ubiquinol oxidase subunit I